MKTALWSRACAVAMMTLAAGAARAATYNITGGGTALATAITTANGNAGADIISIDDSMTYSGDLPAVSETVTILASGANTPLISKTSNTNNPTINQVIQFTPVSGTGVLTVRGASSAAKMTIENLLNASPLINTGPNTLDTHNVVLQDLKLRKGTTATFTGAFINFNNANSADHTIQRVEFGARLATATDAAVLVGASTGVTGGGSVSFDSCDFRTVGSAAAPIIQTNAVGFAAGKTLQFLNCTIEPGAGATGGMYAFSFLHTLGNVSVSGGTLGTGGNTAGWPSVIAPATSAPGTCTFKDVVWKACGSVAFNLDAAINNNMNYVFQGTSAAAKMNLTPAMAAPSGQAAFVRTRGSDLTFTNCTSTSSGTTQRLTRMLDSVGTGPLIGTVNLTLTGCDFANNGGCVSAGDAAGSAFSVIINATNCIWRGSGLVPAFTLSGGRTGASSITLNYCTLRQAFSLSTIGMVETNTTNNVTGRDTLIGNSTIFDPSNGSANESSHTFALTGSNNIRYNNGTSPFGAFFYGEPVGTINTNPLVDSTGHIQAGSSAIDVGTSTNPGTDVDGNTRPLGGGLDIGADEFIPTATATPTPTASSTPTATATLSPTATPTLSASPTLSPTATATLSPTATATLSPTSTPTLSPTATATLSPTATPTLSPTATPTLSATATQSPSPTATLSPTATVTLTPTVSPTATPTLSPTATPTLSPTATATHSPTATPTQSPTVTPTVSPTATLSPTATPTLSPTATASPTATDAPTTTATQSPTGTATATPTATDTATPAPTGSDTASPTATATDTPAASDTPSPTPPPNASKGWELYE